MMTLVEVQEYLARLTYKPGWTLSAYLGRWEGLHLVIYTIVPDAFKEGSVELGVHSFIPWPESAEELQRWVAWRLGRIEVHEMREWLKLDGKVIDSPHAENANQDL